MKVIPKQCAIYCRKSSEEGLDQEFNSLDAQRESCEAYITSQRAEGWHIIPTHYDDGGYSGGNMNRPALQALLEDIKAGKVQTVVVYKIDRLTRSLMDFSKLVDIFDEHGVTFISVTQSFNTTTSMGRLTLNVLLSFAQFEREVTSERIRDKIAASKKKGMWMGGVPPAGYKRIDKKLVPNPDETGIVTYIFSRYIELKSVRALAEDLDKKGIITPVRTSQRDNRYGGKPFSRGQLYTLLSNPVYTGKIRHKNILHEGQHDAIIDDDTFRQAQDILEKNKVRHKEQNTESGAMLKGLLFDPDGGIYSPTYTIKQHKRYSYYISQNLIRYRDHPKGIMARIPSHEIEQAVISAIGMKLRDPDIWLNAFPDIDNDRLNWLINNPAPVYHQIVRAITDKIILNEACLDIRINTKKLRTHICKQLEVHIPFAECSHIDISTPFKTSKGRDGAIILESKTRIEKDPFDLPADKLKRIVRGIIWREEHFDGATLKQIATRGGHGENYVNRCIQESLAFPSK